MVPAAGYCVQPAKQPFGSVSYETGTLYPDIKQVQMDNIVILINYAKLIQVFAYHIFNVAIEGRRSIDQLE